MTNKIPIVLYTDNHLLVVNKPPGWLSQPNDTQSPSIEEWGKAWLKKTYNKPGNVFLHAVHRLDKPVSGIVLLARTSKALSRLQEYIRKKQMKKLYLAIVEGTPSLLENTVEHHLAHGSHQAHVVNPKHTGSALSRLHYRVLMIKKGLSLLAIWLETGRYHQIRAQLAALGHPIFGDNKYGSKKNSPQGTIALHHCRLRIPHPTENKLLEFTAPVPVEWPLWDSQTEQLLPNLEV